MKALKRFFGPSPPPSPQRGLCKYCQKKLKPAYIAERCCSDVDCRRKLDWDVFARELCRAEEAKPRSEGRPSLPNPDVPIRRAAMESAARRRPGTHPIPASYVREQSPFTTDSSGDEPNHPQALARNRSLPERSRHRAGSHHIPKTAPSGPIPSSAGRTPARSLKPLRLPDEQCSYRSEASSPRSERRYRCGNTDGCSEAPSPTSSPTSSSPTLFSHSPVVAKQHDAQAPPLPSTPPYDSPALSRVGRHNKSASDLLFLAPASPSASPPSHHVFPTMLPDGHSSNALGLAVKPFLVRTPSHPSSRAHRKKMDADLPPIPRDFSELGHERARAPPAPAPPHPRYRDGTLMLRPGYGRREPRPRSKSFSGFLKMPSF